MVKLHLGCGNKKFRGYVNIDSSGSPDVFADITKLDIPDNSVSEIICIHTFEHLYPQKAVEILKHWKDKLVDGGKLIMEMPDLKKVLEFFNKPDSPITHTMFALYGGEQDGRPENTHKWCWSFSTIKPALEAAGYKDIIEKPAMYHVRDRDFRVEAVK